MRNPMQGWQTISAAVKKTGVSRQWLSSLAKKGAIRRLLINGDYWVKDPLPYKPDMARVKRATDSYKKVLDKGKA